jgi:hypothetical protein
MQRRFETYDAVGGAGMRRGVKSACDADHHRHTQDESKCANTIGMTETTTSSKIVCDDVQGAAFDSERDGAFRAIRAGAAPGAPTRGNCDREAGREVQQQKASLTVGGAAELRRRVAQGGSKAALAREFGISRDTLYRYVPVKKRGKR